MKQLLLAVILLPLLLNACAPNVSPHGYSSNQVGAAAPVEPAVVVSMRKVTINQNTGVGGVTGAAAGAVAGSSIGGGDRSNALGAIGGAVVGGLVGHAAEDTINKQEAYEYVLRSKEDGRMISVTQSHDLQLHKGQQVLIIYGDMVRIVPDNT